MTSLIGSKQLAKQLGISLRTLDSLDKAGQLPRSLRIGHLRRWRADDVEEWIDKRVTASRPGHLQ
jgi:excisionase family DNA binding protein